MKIIIWCLFGKSGLDDSVGWTWPTDRQLIITEIEAFRLSALCHGNKAVDLVLISSAESLPVPTWTSNSWPSAAGSVLVTHLRRPKPIFLLFFSVSSGSSVFFFSLSFPFALFFSFFLTLVFFFFSFLPFSSTWSPTPWRDELLAGVSRPELRSEPSSEDEIKYVH